MRHCLRCWHTCSLRTRYPMRSWIGAALMLPTSRWPPRTTAATTARCIPPCRPVDSIPSRPTRSTCRRWGGRRKCGCNRRLVEAAVEHLDEFRRRQKPFAPHFVELLRRFGGDHLFQFLALLLPLLHPPCHRCQHVAIGFEVRLGGERAVARNDFRGVVCLRD